MTTKDDKAVLLSMRTMKNLGHLDSGFIELDSIDTSILEANHPKSISIQAIDQIHPRPEATNHRVLGVCGITAITYFVGCGGPIRTEPIISAGGPLIGLGSLIIYPLFVTFPYAYIVAELCSAFPEDGGFSIWVLHAFGPFWGFQVGYWSWISGIFKSALLPSFFLQMIYEYNGGEIQSDILEYLIKALIAIVLTIPSVLGSKVVEKGCFTLLVIVGLTTLLFSVWGYAKATHFEDLWEVRHERIVMNGTEIAQSGDIEIQWTSLLNTLFLSFDGINTASLFGGEVSNPARVYGRAIALTVGLTFATYFLPLPPAIAVRHPNWTLFDRNTFPHIADFIGSGGLEIVIVISSMCSVVGLFIAGLYCKSFEMSGMAERQMLPQMFAVRNQRFDSPHISILATLGVTLILLGVDFDDLVPLTNIFAGGVQIMIVCSVVRLRQLLPYIPRPTRVPGGVWMLGSMAVLPIGVVCYIMFDALSNFLKAIIIFVFLLPGMVYGYLKVKVPLSSANSSTAIP